jgi:hypothetical protein
MRHTSLYIEACISCCCCSQLAYRFACCSGFIVRLQPGAQRTAQRAPERSAQATGLSGRAAKRRSRRPPSPSHTRWIRIRTPSDDGEFQRDYPTRVPRTCPTPCVSAMDRPRPRMLLAVLVTVSTLAPARSFMGPLGCGGAARLARGCARPGDLLAPLAPLAVRGTRSALLMSGGPTKPPGFDPPPGIDPKTVRVRLRVLPAADRKAGRLVRFIRRGSQAARAPGRAELLAAWQCVHLCPCNQTA